MGDAMEEIVVAEDDGGGVDVWTWDAGAAAFVASDASFSSIGGNYGNYKKPEYDKLMDKAVAERDPAKQIELLKQANNYLFDDPPCWFFNYNKAVMAYHPWVKGLKPVAIELMFQDMTEVWVDESSPRAKQK